MHINVEVAQSVQRHGLEVKLGANTSGEVTGGLEIANGTSSGNMTD